MKKLRRPHSGLTMVEILISMALIVLLITAATHSTLASQFLASYSKHKIQAAYVAQQLLEQQRRTSFASIASAASAAVTLDTNGTYGTTTDDFNGNRIITVTSIDTYRKTVQIEINWLERVGPGKVTEREYFKATIAKEPELN